MTKLEQAARNAIHKINQATALDEESDELLMEAVTALQESLEQPDEIDWIETNKALAKEIINLKKQAEQEPDYFGLTHDHTWLSIDKKQYDKLKPEGRMACYAAPVRTKDLTEAEIDEIWKKHSGGNIGFARAAIAADREKNK